METETIKKDAKKAIIEKLNRALQVEYDLIFNYPRVFDQLANIYKIHDERLNSTIETLGKESLRHFSEIDKLIVKLGGETQWDIKTPGGSGNLEEALAKQLEKEKWAISWYTSVKQIAEQGKAGFLDRVAIGSDFVDANETINMMDRLIRDEKRHAMLIKSSINTWKKLMNK